MCASSVDTDYRYRYIHIDIFQFVAYLFNLFIVTFDEQKTSICLVCYSFLYCSVYLGSCYLCNGHDYNLMYFLVEA